MIELTSDLENHLRDFQEFCAKFNENDRNNKELNSMLKHIEHENAILKENDKKSAEQIKILRQICNEQVKAISELHDFKKKNEILIEENTNFQNLIQNLKTEIDLIEIKNNETIQSYIVKHKVELDEKENQFNKRERDLQEKIEVLQASYDLEMNEKDMEKKNLKINCDKQLKKATDKEQEFKNEIFKLNNQLSSSTAVLQKKIHELEQKLKTSEREKSMFTVTQGNFTSANNVLRNHPYPNQTLRNNNDNNSVNLIPTSNSIIRNVSQNIENNTAKKFQFRKSHRSSNENVEKRLLSESFDPFEMNKQMKANSQSWNQNNKSSKQMNAENSTNDDVIYDIIEDNSENTNNSLQEYKLEAKKSDITIIDDKDNEVNIVDKNQKNNMKQVSPSFKKRKLFNPKNLEYLS